MGVVEQPIEERGDGGRVAEQLAPVIDEPVRCQERGGPFIAPHDHLQEVLGGGVRELAQAEVADDEQRDRRQLDEPRAALTLDPQTETGRCVAQLQTLQGIGSIGAWSLTTEIFGWRQIRNGRELGALVGLVPAPYQSGATSHDQGITRAGNRHVRRMIVQLAWSWLRYQPTSALSRWYRERFSHGRRLRRIGIVALARKLLIALWRYVETGHVPEGAILKSLAA